MINLYNQTIDKYSKMGCIQYGIGHIMLLNFGIEVSNNFLLKVLRLTELATVWSSVNGGVFETVYNWNIAQIESKLGLKLKVVKKTITILKEDDTNCYGLGIKNFNSNFVKAFDDSLLTYEEAIEFKEQKGIGHHICWDSGKLIDSWTGKVIDCPLDTLKKLVKLGVLWDTCRTILPATPISEKILHYCKRMREAENQGKLDEYMETNKNETWFSSAKKLYFYGKGV